MLDLGTTEFVLAVPSFPEAELKRLSTSLFDAWDRYVDTALSLSDYSLFLQVDEGSVRGAAKIGAMAGALYFAIGNYGDFTSGIKTIGEQISATSEFLSEHAKETFHCPDEKAKSRKRGGAVAGLQRLFVRVQKGEMSPEEVMQHAEQLIGDQHDEVPGFKKSLFEAFRDCPRHHQQEKLPFEASIGDVLMPNLPAQPSSPKRSGHSIELAPPLQLRIEVWRDSKRKRRQTRVVKL